MTVTLFFLFQILSIKRVVTVALFLIGCFSMSMRRVVTVTLIFIGCFSIFIVSVSDNVFKAFTDSDYINRILSVISLTG